MSEKVTSLRGGDVPYERKPNAACIEMMRDMLERAESGEIVGAVVATLYHDASAGWSVGGKVGGYSMLGAIEMARHEIVEVNRE